MIPPHLDLQFERPPGSCPHPEYNRYGNDYGKFARCKRCQKRWRWNQHRQLWEEHPDTAKGLHLESRLPLPSSSNTAPPSSAPGTPAISANRQQYQPSSRTAIAAAKPKTTSTRRLPRRSRATGSDIDMSGVESDSWRFLQNPPPPDEETNYQWDDSEG